MVPRELFSLNGEMGLVDSFVVESEKYEAVVLTLLHSRHKGVY